MRATHIDRDALETYKKGKKHAWAYAREFSDETGRLMDHAIRGLVEHAFDRAIDILNVHRSVHETTAQLLLQKETLEDDDLAALRAQIAQSGASEAIPEKPMAAAAR
jgi:ATP-dependent Zn protease